MTQIVAEGLRAGAPGLAVRVLDQPVLGAEDFSRCREKLPGTFGFLGTTAPGRPAEGSHRPTYLPDPRAPRWGTEALLVAADSVQRSLAR